MDSTPAPDRLQALAEIFNINFSKPHFPVNTMRLYYLLLTDSLTQSHQETLKAVNSLIPKISAVFDARDQVLQSSDDSSPKAQFHACTPALTEIKTIIQTPLVDHTFNLLFTETFPLQETLLKSLDKHLHQNNLEISDLHTIIKIRAMDSVAYATLIGEIIKRHLADQSPDLSPLLWQVNLSLQINDIADAVIYAKQDLESGSASLIDILKRLSPDGPTAQNHIRQTLKHFLTQSDQFPLPTQTQTDITDFNHRLISVLGLNPTSL